MDLLRYVNSFWNTWPYREDIDNWGQEDYWEIPSHYSPQYSVNEFGRWAHLKGRKLK